MIYVQADQDCPVYPELRGLLAKTAGLVDLLREALNPFLTQIAICFVYGSIARAEETSLSDIDLFIIGDVGLRDLAPILQKTQQQTGREVNPQLFRAEEFAKRVGAGDHFALNVLKKPKLFIVGTQNELDNITQRKAGDGGTVKQV